MKLPSTVKTAGFVIACLVWLLAGLTLLGPKVGEQFFYSINDTGPKQPMASLVCPQRAPLGEMAVIAGRYENRSGKTQNYETSIEIQKTGDSFTTDTSCSRPDTVPDGQAGEIHCSFGPVDQITRVRVTARAEGENTCDSGCPNSYRSTCVIMPDIWLMLGQTDSLTVLIAILALGVVLIILGARLWGGAGSTSRLVMIGFFAASALMLALAESQTFVHWLPAAILLALLVMALAAAALWSQRTPGAQS